jgi:hypothetical protein
MPSLFSYRSFKHLKGKALVFAAEFMKAGSACGSLPASVE